MKRYLLLLISILLLCTILCACDPATPDVPTDTTVGSVTEAPTEAPTEETTEEVTTEAPTEPETEPEVLVEAIAPKKVLLTLVEDVTVVEISSISKQVTLPDTALDGVKNAFVQEGYIVAATTAANGSNLGTTVLKSQGHVVTLMQTKDGSLHVLWEKAENVSTDPLYAPRSARQGEVIMAQIGIARGNSDDNPMIGMCYVYRLADGTALIIDGGVNNDDCAKNIYDTLGKLDIAKDENGKYRITAWIFTHGHSDHMGAFKAFSAAYAEETDLAYAMFNFPTEEVAPSGSTQDGPFFNIIRRAYPNVQRVAPHAGLTYFFGNLSVHMLFAPELVYTTVGVDYYNTTSLLFRIEVNGQSILHMGDASEVSSKAAWTENSSAAFQSTALQITHHGLYTGADGSHTWSYMKKIYLATNASVGLLPMGTRKPGDARNGRHTVLVGWGNAGYQISFVLNTKKSATNSINTDQAFFDRFAADKAAGTAEYETLFGYDGVNTIVNRSGMVTYVNATETEPMATVFSLTGEGMTVVTNEILAAWLGQ